MSRIPPENLKHMRGTSGQTLCGKDIPEGEFFFTDIGHWFDYAFSNMGYVLCYQCWGAISRVRNRELHRVLQRDFRCEECGAPAHANWMVKDEVWFEVYPVKKGLTPCLPCFVRRLGRSLTADDFQDLPINKTVKFLCEHGT